jgi:hypothetical protein
VHKHQNGVENEEACILHRVAGGPILIIMGCQYDEGTSVNSTGTSDSREQGAQVLDYTPAWDQAGIDHNRCMAYVDEWLIHNFDKKWKKDEAGNHVKVAILAFLADSMGYDTAEARILGEEVIAFKPTFGENTNMMVLVDDLKKQGSISPREELDLRRVVEIVFVHDLDSIALTDSLESLRHDMSNVLWNEKEVIGPACCSVAFHSWDFRKTGWKFDPDGDGIPISLVINWGRVGSADLGGALAGSPGGVGGAVGGAAFGSAWDMWMQSWEDYW